MQTNGGGGSLAALEQLPRLRALALTLHLRLCPHPEQRELAAALVRLTVRQGLESGLRGSCLEAGRGAGQAAGASAFTSLGCGASGSRVLLPRWLDRVLQKHLHLSPSPLLLRCGWVWGLESCVQCQPYRGTGAVPELITFVS